MSSLLRLLSIGLVSLSVSGCGTFVPNLQEFPGSPADGQLLVNAIVETVRCEVQDAVKSIILQDKALVASRVNPVRSAPWFDDWGVQAGLVLTVEERTALNPAALYNPTGLQSPPVTFAFGAVAAATATRVTTLNFYYTVKELVAAPACGSRPTASRLAGSLLLQSDLKLAETLAAHVLASGTGALLVPGSRSAPSAQNAIAHRVKFEVLTSGSVSPSWRLTHATTNPNSTLFSTSRNRTHDLTLTLGPADPAARELLGPASQVFFANQLNAILSRRD
ncbi:hypothetical protein [Bosea sp. AAP35]|uniref:hypothetical protein n=1 Tax=Bosea sp. AAP35 TaxID=1523417 RepID=UPI0006B88EB1|nr:hypothetical protein [Bosea sp. AAP35]